MTDVMYQIPSEDDVEEVFVTKECLTDGAKPRVVYKQNPPDQNGKESRSRNIKKFRGKRRAKIHRIKKNFPMWQIVT